MHPKIRYAQEHPSPYRTHQTSLRRNSPLGQFPAVPKVFDGLRCQLERRYIVKINSNCHPDDENVTQRENNNQIDHSS